MRILRYLDGLETEGLLEERFSYKSIRQYFEDLCESTVHQTLSDILEDKSSILSLTQKNIISGLIKDKNKKTVTRVKLLDGPNVSSFLILSLNRLLNKNIQLKAIFERADSIHRSHQEYFEEMYLETLETIAFSFSEDNLFKISYDDFIKLDIFMSEFLGSLENGSKLVQSWSSRSGKFFTRLTLNIYLDTLKIISSPVLSVALVDKKLSHSLGHESISKGWPETLLTNMNDLTSRMNSILMENTMGESLARIIEQVFKVCIFIVQISHLQHYYGQIEGLMSTVEELSKVSATIKLILRCIVLLTSKSHYEMTNPQHQVSLFTEEPGEAEKKNLWDRSGVFRMAVVRRKDSGVMEAISQIKAAQENGDIQQEVSSYLKHANTVKVEEQFINFDNKFILLESLVMCFLNCNRVNEISKCLSDLHILDESCSQIVAKVSSSVQRVTLGLILEEKVPKNTVLMCMVNRKFEEGKPKEYHQILSGVISDLESKSSFILKGAIHQADIRHLSYKMKLSILDFVLEILQDMLTKLNFSNEAFDRLAEDYTALKRVLSIAPDLTKDSDGLSQRLIELKDIIPDKQKLVDFLCQHCLSFSILFLRKISEKYFNPSETNMIRDAVRSSLSSPTSPAIK